MGNTDLALFDAPMQSRDKNHPFNLRVEFDQYRRNREYQIHIETSVYYESFMLHARGQDRPDGNATLVGWFVALPPIGMDLNCLGKRKSSVVNKARPVRIGNLTFTWKAPPTDYGPIQFVASIVKDNKYAVIKTKEITFNGFPVSTRDCGRDISCFKECFTSPNCTSDESAYMVVINLSKNKKEVTISLGGIVENEQKYVAVGFGDDKENLKNMDICACYKEAMPEKNSGDFVFPPEEGSGQSPIMSSSGQGENIRLGHYLLEHKMGPAYLHRSPIRLTGQDMDPKTNFIWCQYRRPVMPRSMWDLDLSHPMFHFYFSGKKNGSMIIMPEMKDIWNSKMRRNFSEITNDILFSGSNRPGTFGLAGGLFATLLMAFA